jgi:hypothetical protein
MMLPMFSLIRREFIRWIRAPTWVISGLMSPILYLLLFGQAFNHPGLRALQCALGRPELLLLLRGRDGGIRQRHRGHVLGDWDHLR